LHQQKEPALPVQPAVLLLLYPVEALRKCGQEWEEVRAQFGLQPVHKTKETVKLHAGTKEFCCVF